MATGSGKTVVMAMLIATREIDEFKTDYRARFPGRDSDNLTDEDFDTSWPVYATRADKCHISHVVGRSSKSPTRGTHRI